MSFFSSKAEEKINLNDEELPAIDPFKDSSASMNNNQTQQSTNSSETEETEETEETKVFINDLRLVGTIIGEKKIYFNNNFCSGDLLFGIPSSGFHTNGFSLIRNIYTLFLKNKLIVCGRVYFK